jgi:hypothetical protein
MIKHLKTNDADYPCSMCLVKNKNDYDLIKVENVTYVPLYQVIDLIWEQEKSLERKKNESKRSISCHISIS